MIQQKNRHKQWNNFSRDVGLLILPCCTTFCFTSCAMAYMLFTLITAVILHLAKVLLIQHWLLWTLYSNSYPPTVVVTDFLGIFKLPYCHFSNTNCIQSETFSYLYATGGIMDRLLKMLRLTIKIPCSISTQKLFCISSCLSISCDVFEYQKLLCIRSSLR